MQKAFKWLYAKKIKYTFHDYKVSGIDKETLELWLQHFAIDKLVNTKSTTYKGLTDKEKSFMSDKTKAMELMMKYNSIIKRPVWDLGNGNFLLGWDEKAVNAAIDKL